MIAPKSAAPIAPPSERLKVVALVATPMSRMSTEFWTGVTIVIIARPSPMPNRKA